MRHGSWMVMIRVAECQHGVPFLRLVMDHGTQVLDNPVADIEVRPCFFFHNIDFLIYKFSEELIDLLHYCISLLINSIQEVSHVITLQHSSLSMGKFKFYRFTWDPGGW